MSGVNERGVADTGGELVATGGLGRHRLSALVSFVLATAVAILASCSAAMAESTSTSCIGVPGKSYLASPVGWANQCQMVNDSDVLGAGLDRQTWVLDPGQGNFLTRDQLLAHASNYERFGFTKQFLWWAPMTKVHPAPSSQWSDCKAPDYRLTGVFCTSSVGPSVHTVGQDLTSDTTLDAIAYRNDWIALACGNFHLPVSGANPAPVITGFKYNDLNRDKKLDNGEPGLGGMTFTLSRVASFVGQSNASDLATTTSASDGSFRFVLDRNDEGPGTYVVTERYDSNWPNTTPLSQTIVVPEGAGDGQGLPTLRFGDRQEIPPVAIAASRQVDQASPSGTLVTLDGTGSYSPTGDPITYHWSWQTTTGVHTATGTQPTVLMPPGTTTVTLAVSDGLKSDTTSVPVTVFAPITAHSTTAAGTEGKMISGPVATFTDPDPNGLPSDYVATIDWGDGTAASVGTITKAAGGTFTVTGAHTYADEGAYAPIVTITDDDVPYNTAAVADAVNIADAPIAATGVDFLSTNPVNQTLANFTDANPGGSVADFSATIDWGDGATTAGQVSGGVGGPFAVAGSHSYTTLGYKTITIHIIDDGGSTTTAIDHVIIYQPSGFVIGDLNSAVGTHVTYWGAKWWKLNGLSGGAAPAAFKGYEDSPGPSTALTGWSTHPGNSSGPPRSVPTFMSVIVSSSITKSGSTINADAPHIVIVQTDSGYAPNPGHAGTGTVVAALR